MVTTSSMPRRTRSSAGTSTQAAPASAPAASISGMASGRGTAAHKRPDAGRRDGAGQQLALRADVPEARPEGDGDRGAGEAGWASPRRAPPAAVNWVVSGDDEVAAVGLEGFAPAARRNADVKAG